MGSGWNLHALLLISSILVVNAVISSPMPFDFARLDPASPPCAECLVSAGEEEGGEYFALDTESNRRILATTRYISYGALRRNTVPCSRRGASYYNCRPGAEANPYSRGCSRITLCRS